MATKTPYYNEDLPTLRFPWALKVSDFSELLLVSGHADVKPDNRTANFPGDLIAQARFILDQISKSIEAAGFTLQDAIRTEITLTKEVTDDQLPELFELLKDYVGEVEVKPATHASLRRLAHLSRVFGRDRTDAGTVRSEVLWSEPDEHGRRRDAGHS